MFDRVIVEEAVDPELMPFWCLIDADSMETSQRPQSMAPERPLVSS